MFVNTCYRKYVADKHAHRQTQQEAVNMSDIAHRCDDSLVASRRGFASPRDPRFPEIDTNATRNRTD